MHCLSIEPKVDGPDAIRILWEGMMQVSQAICKVVVNVIETTPSKKSITLVISDEDCKVVKKKGWTFPEIEIKF